MKKAKITFFKCVQDSQEFGSNDEHMISRIFFNAEYNGTVNTNLYAQIKQAVGSSFNEEQIEVSFPEGITGPFNFVAFSEAAKEYFLRLVGSGGSGINIGGGCSNIRMMNNTFQMPFEVEFDISEPGTAW